MTVSDQIIAVLNALCEKFGIVIDWTATNILPYIQNLGSRIVTYEMATSIAWLIGATIFYALILFVVFYVFKHDESGEGFFVGMVIAIFGTILYIPILGKQIGDIIKCCTIPETIIIHYVKELMEVIK